MAESGRRRRLHGFIKLFTGGSAFDTNGPTSGCGQKIERLYESAPVGEISQPRYLNTAIVGRVHLAPEPMLAVLKFLEARLQLLLHFLNSPTQSPRTLITLEQFLLELGKLRGDVSEHQGL